MPTDPMSADAIYQAWLGALARHSPGLCKAIPHEDVPFGPFNIHRRLCVDWAMPHCLAANRQTHAEGGLSFYLSDLTAGEAQTAYALRENEGNIRAQHMVLILAGLCHLNNYEIGREARKWVIQAESSIYSALYGEGVFRPKWSSRSRTRLPGDEVFKRVHFELIPQDLIAHMAAKVSRVFTDYTLVYSPV